MTTATQQTHPSSGTSEVTIEHALPRDVSAISALLIEGDLAHQAFDRIAIRQGEPHPVDREWLAVSIGDPDQCVLVARAAHCVVGMVRVRLARQDASRLMKSMTFAVVEEIVVCAETRRMGIGRRLMDEVVAWARVAGAIRIQLGVYSRNEDARAFYRRLGYGELVHTLCLDLP